MSYGDQDTVLEKRYVPRRSQRTRSVLTFIAQDGQEHTIIYANAELTSRQQPGEVVDFCRLYNKTHGELPKLLVFDQKLTTNEHLAELDALGVGFITLRQRHPKLIEQLKALPASARTKTRLDRSGKHKSRSPSTSTSPSRSSPTSSTDASPAACTSPTEATPPRRSATT
jgi:hypothetical protein